MIYAPYTTLTVLAIREKQPYASAVQWTGDNTMEVVKWAYGGWPEHGVWIKQLYKTPYGAPEYLLVINEDRVVPKGGYLVKLPTGKFGNQTAAVITGGDEEWFAKRYEIVPTNT